MSKMNNSQIVEQQYANEKNLQLRIAFNQKYSMNKQAFSDWVFDFYNLFEGCRVLELGCGTGAFWEDKINNLPKDTNIILSDFSDGMLDIVSKKYSHCQCISTEKINIEDIPYHDNSFDIVIANHMLYHVPDIAKAISEVHRVLKQNGIFYATTNGIDGMPKFLNTELKKFDPNLDVFSEKLYPFTLQNGKKIIGEKFNNIKMHEYKNTLNVTKSSDLVDYILSSATMSGFDVTRYEELCAYFEKNKNSDEGILIPITAGIFISAIPPSP